MEGIKLGLLFLVQKPDDLEIRQGDIEIKWHSKVTYLGIILDYNLSGDSYWFTFLGKINGGLEILYMKQNFLNFFLFEGCLQLSLFNHILTMLTLLGKLNLNKKFKKKIIPPKMC